MAEKAFGTIHYDQTNAGRSEVPSSGIVDKVHAAANKVHPGIDTHLGSGQEPKGRAPVGTRDRHPNGFAGDFSFSIDGKKVTDQGILRDIAKTVAAEYGANVGYSNVAYDPNKTKQENKQAGYYMGPATMHIDTMPLDKYPGGPQWGKTAKQWADMLNTARKSGIGVFLDEVNVPPTREQGLAGALTPEQMGALPGSLSPQQQALANAQIAYGASRALNAQPLSMSPPNPGSIRGLNVPSALSRPSAPPSNFSVPARPSAIGSAPVGAVSRAPLGPALNRPSPPSNFAGGTTPAAAPSMRQAAGTPTAGYAPKAQAAGTPTAGYNPKAQAAGTPTAGYNVSMPSGISRPAAPSQAAIAGALSQAQGKIAADAKAYADFEAARAQAFSSLPGPPTTVNHPPNPTVGIPAAIPTVAAPALAPPTVIAPPPAVYQPRPVHQVAPVAMRPAPAATAYDVYSGMADTAMDSVGNRVSSIPGGTTVTNKYGATTGMVNGYQTAVGSMPSIPGMSGPVASKIGQSVKNAAPKVGLGLLGGLIAGPIGALAGALLGNQIAKQSALSKQSALAPTASQGAASRSGGGLSGGSRAGANNGVRPDGGGYQTSAGAQSNSKSMRY